MLELQHELSQVYWNIALSFLPAIVSVLGILIYGYFRLRHWLFPRPDDQSEGVQKTFLGSLGNGLPLDLSLVANAGRKADAPRTFSQIYLRPTIGLRLINFGFPVLLFYILHTMQTTNGSGLANDYMTQVMAAILLVLMVHNIIYFGIYELRYDTTYIVHRTWFYQRLELPTSRLLSIRDDGMYFYILRSDNGKKVYVPKHLVGIEDFVTFVREEIYKNDAY